MSLLLVKKVGSVIGSLMALLFALPSHAATSPDVKSVPTDTIIQATPPVIDIEEAPTTGWLNSKAGILSANYLGRFSKAALLNFDMRYSYLNLGGGFNVAGEGNSWNIYAGVGDTYRINKNIFIDGGIGLMYGHYSYEYSVSTPRSRYTPIKGGQNSSSSSNTTREKISEGNFGLYFRPTIGFMFLKDWGIQVGYMMTAPKLKFDHTFDKGDIILGIFCILN